MSALLFSLNIKLGKEVFKLPVLANDSMGKVISRLAMVAGVPVEKRDGIGPKLNHQLRYLLGEGKLSEKVRRKVMSLLGKEQEKQRSPEAHFRILRQSLDRAKLNCQIEHKKHFKYLQEGPNLNVNYPSVDANKVLNHHRSITHQPSLSPHRLLVKNESEESSLIRKYQALDRKCDEFISKNIKNNNISERNGAITARIRNQEQYASGRHSFPLKRSITPSEVDCKFSKLNLEAVKVIGERTGITHFHTQRSPINRSPHPFQMDQRRTGRRYNYLNMEP